MSYLSIFGLEFDKTIVILKSAASNLLNGKISQKKQKCLNLGPKMPYLSIFGLEFGKAIVISEINKSNFSKMSL